jgi:hypothetical protein
MDWQSLQAGQEVASLPEGATLLQGTRNVRVSVFVNKSRYMTLTQEATYRSLLYLKKQQEVHDLQAINQ